MRHSVKKLKIGKAAGPSGIVAQMLKKLVTQCTSLLTQGGMDALRLE